MGKYFTFVDRMLTIEFFETDPVKITMLIGDEMDKKLIAMGAAIDSAKTAEKARAALADIIGEENTQKILARAEDVDRYFIAQVARYILSEYGAGKAKNIETAGAGRSRK